MSLELTEAQRRTIMDGQPVRMQFPEVGGDVVLLRGEEYDSIREILDDERRMKSFRDAALRSARRWADDNPY